MSTGMSLDDRADALARAQSARPKLFLAAGAFLCLVAVALVSTLRFDASYEALLPQASPELENARAVRELTGGTRQVVVAIGGGDRRERLSFGRELEERIEQLEGVRHVELEFPVDFLRRRVLWLAEEEALTELVGAVELALRRAEEEGDDRALRLALGRVRAELDSASLQRFAEGTLESRDGRYTFLVVVPSIPFYHFEAAGALLEQIQAEGRSLDPGSRGLHLRYAGNLSVVQEHQRQMATDLRDASALALLLGVLLVGLYFRRPLAPLIVGVSLVAGVLWTFALAAVLVGNLNVITGFLVAVLIGLGIDFGVHLAARHQQELAADPGQHERALRRAVRGTLKPALTSALTTAGTFFSFAAGRFRGFSEFGLIAGFGVLLTMASAFLLLPPLLILLRPRSQRVKAVTLPVPSVPRSASAGVVVAFAAVALYGAVHAVDVPFVNDFVRLRGTSETTEFTRYVDENLGAGFNPAVIVVEGVEALRQVDQVVEGRRADGEVGRTLSLIDLLPPADASRRQALLDRIGRWLAHPAIAELARTRPDGAEALARVREMTRAEPWTVGEIPEPLRRRFQSPSGEHLLFFLWPARPVVTDRRALAWEGELDEISRQLAATGVEHRLADETLIIGWIYRLVASDGPWLLTLAAAVVFLMLLLDLRSLRRALLVVTPMAVGVALLEAVMFRAGLELNMFNMVVVPSVLGIGIDNAVHIYHRYRSEGPGSIRLVVRQTGAAAALASVTTAMGFGSSLISDHVGLRSLGLLAVLGIGCSLLATVVFFPALLQLLERRRRGTKN